MKILIVSDAGSIHTKRWVSSLKERGVQVLLYTITVPSDHFYEDRRIPVHCYDLFSYKRSGRKLNPVQKVLRHCRAVSDLRKVIGDFAPNILHAHYATSYGLLAALSGFHPFLISVWGSDVYEFPNQSVLNRLSVKYIFRKSDRILSTSHVMAQEIRKYTRKDIRITPFGVDIERFRIFGNRCPDGEFRIGTVKTLSEKYGIDILIRSFHLFSSRLPDGNFVLEIVGDGPDRAKLERLTEELHISDKVVFTGYVDNSALPAVFNRFDVAVFLSMKESFGVSAVEAMACGCPVVVSDADGFQEVVENGVSGIIVPRNEANAAADAIRSLYEDSHLRQSLSRAARERAVTLYDWRRNVDGMVEIYLNAVHGNGE